MNVGDYREALAKALEGGDSDESATDGSSTVDFKTKAAIVVLKSGFLKPEKKGDDEGEKSYTLKGQRAEKPVLQRFYDYGEEKFALKAMYCTGLNTSAGNNYNTIIRNSPDASVINEYDEAVPVEVKNRVTPATFRRQIEAIQRISRNKGNTDNWSMILRCL